MHPHPRTETKNAEELEPGDAVINIGMVRSVEADGTEIIVTLESGERLPVTPERNRFVVFKRNKAFERHVAEDMAYFGTLPPGRMYEFE